LEEIFAEWGSPVRAATLWTDFAASGYEEIASL
jgi:hypothetical protein